MKKPRSTLTARATPPDEISPAVRRALGDVEALRALDQVGQPVAQRAQAATELAFLLGRRRNADALEEAATRVAKAQELSGLTRTIQARLAHAEGYVLYQQGHERSPVAALNRAAELYPSTHHLRARVFDTLGQYFQHTAGDLDRARSYYERAYAEKEALIERYGIDQMWEGLAITSGNLGRLEVTLERWAAAEKWTVIDLDLEQRHGASSAADDDASVTATQRSESRRARAMLHGQLARIALGRGAGGHDATAKAHGERAKHHIEHALALVPNGSYTEVTLWFDSARVQLLLGDRVAAERHIEHASMLAETGRYAHLDAYVRYVRGLVLSGDVTSPLDPRVISATAEFNEAMAKFASASQPQEQCDVIYAMALMLFHIGRHDEARRLIVERGIPLAERSLFGQLQPLARLEALLGEMDSGQLAEIQQRRMRGGLGKEEHTGRLRGETRVITVWTCDIRGFAAYCEAHDDAEVVATLNRFFHTLGEPIIEAGGVIDKYVGDNILAYFPSATSAAGVALGALRRVEELNTEWQQLHKQTLDIGIGLATGPAVVGTVGFGQKLEHTIIGSTVNLACRLVGVAKAGEIAIDEATMRALGGGFVRRPIGRTGKVRLKGFDSVKAWLLEGRAEGGRRPRRR